MPTMQLVSGAELTAQVLRLFTGMSFVAVSTGTRRAVVLASVALLLALMGLLMWRRSDAARMPRSYWRVYLVLVIAISLLMVGVIVFRPTAW